MIDTSLESLWNINFNEVLLVEFPPYS